MHLGLNTFNKKYEKALIKAKRSPCDVTLVVVSKKQAIEVIESCYAMGERHFGENRVQELLEKSAKLPKDITWHYIGPLQRNKVKKLLEIPCVIHSIDRKEILEALLICKKPFSGFLQVNISGEKQKGGFTLQEAEEEARKLINHPFFTFEGFMTMTPIQASQEEKIEIFGTLQRLRNKVSPALKLSMGMSQDYQEALLCGATHLRIGRAIFSPEAAKAS